MPLLTKEHFLYYLAQITELGDSMLLILACVLVSGWLLIYGYRRAAFALWLSFITTAILITAAKLFFMGCYHDTTYGIQSPSGHAALSLATYGMIAVLFGQSTSGMGRACINIIALFLIALIAASRFILGYHSIAEVLVGLVAGFAGLGLACKYFFSWKQEILRFNVPLLLLVLCAIAYLMHGTRLQAEQWVKKIAAELPQLVGFCVQPSQDGSTSRDNSAS
ncbi:MAG: phosphatase PAP2 family protein [Alphaproteobacteria bacterium]